MFETVNIDTITKDNLTIEVIPVYKFIMETAIC